LIGGFRWSVDGENRRGSSQISKSELDRAYNMFMRRSFLTAALLIVVAALPVCAQRRGVSTPRANTSVGVRSSGRVIVRGGVAFGHNPGFGVFVNRRPFHHRRFYNPYAYGYPYAYPYMIYPYYPYGLQSDFVYSSAASSAYGAPAYMADHDSGVQSDLYRLQAELDQVRQQQAAQAERQQYALNTPTDTPRPIPATRPRQETPAPATVLIYRDGHRAEVHNYAVVGQVLWIFSEERARKVPLADLDLDATRKANEERDVEFAVPAKPPSQ
jgi:hypothetical protein